MILRGGDRRRARLFMSDQPAALPPVYDPQMISAANYKQGFNMPYAAGTGSLIVGLGSFLPDDLMIVVITCGDRSLAEPTPHPAGWIRIPAMPDGTAGSRTDIFYRRMVENDEAATVTFVSYLGGVNSTWIARRWNWRNTDPTKAPVAVGLLPASSALRTLNGPALTTGWGPVRAGWMQHIALDRQDTEFGVTPAVTAFPVGYGDTVTDTTDVIYTFGNTFGCAQGSCHKSELAASQLAGSWTFLPSVPGVIGPAFMCAIAVGGN